MSNEKQPKRRSWTSFLAVLLAAVMTIPSTSLKAETNLGIPQVIEENLQTETEKSLTPDLTPVQISEIGDAVEDDSSADTEAVNPPAASEAIDPPADPEAVTYLDSGRSSVAKPTMAQLKSWLSAIPTVTSIYSTEPVVSGKNYKPGVYTSTAKNCLLGWINYYRQAAGLTKISFTDTLNDSAAYGALCLAMLNSGLTHYPSQPADMSDADYDKAYYATSHSNISYSGGYAIKDILPLVINGQMADERASNITTLGHRRWLLNPNTKQMGVGTAHSTSNAYYSAVRVFGDNVSTSTVSDYDFIAWPASGNNLSDTFANSVPWSITLNLDKYGYPDYSKVKVTLTRSSDGKKWNFSSDTDISYAGPSYDFFYVNNGGYGIANCIIFRPAYGEFNEYSGEYIVDVTGLTDRSGNATTLHYKALFASSATHTHNWSLQSWTWASDYSTAKANFVCTEDSSHKTTVNGTIKKTTTKATCTAAGKTVYTATATLDGTTYTSTKTVTIPATGHSWNKAVFTWTGLESAKAKRTCKNNSSHTETVTAVITSKVTVQPTDNAAGKRVYTATATFSDGSKATDTKEEMIPGNLWKWSRMAGANRYETMALITREGYRDGTCNTIVLAAGNVFPDALSGSALAGVYDSPVILTKKSALSEEAKAEIQRLASKDGCEVLILGGASAIPESIEKEILAIGSFITTERIAGTDRYDTAIKVYEKIYSKISSEQPGDEDPGDDNSGDEDPGDEDPGDDEPGDEEPGEEEPVEETSLIDTCILASGAGFADALAISPYAYASETPIFLVKKDGSLKDEVKESLENAGFTYAIIVGGESVVSAETEEWLLDTGISVLRLSGDNRYLTCAEIIRWERGLLPDLYIQPKVVMNVDGMGAATGKNFADALASVSLLGKTQSPLLLLPGSKSATIQSIVDELVQPYAKEIKKGYVFGGSAAVADPLWEMLNLATVE